PGGAATGWAWRGRWAAAPPPSGPGGRPRGRPPRARARGRGRAAPAQGAPGPGRGYGGDRLVPGRGHHRRPDPAPAREGDPPMSIRLMMVDDHPAVRAGLRALLEADPEIEVIDELASGEEALAALHKRATTGDPLPDLVLMDLNLGKGIGGIETTRTLREEHPGVQVLAVTTFDAEADVVGALEAGASGYVLKDSPTEALLEAVRDAAAGRSVLSP